MLYWALVFLVIAAVAGLLGFGPLSVAASIAQVVFFVSIIVFVIALVLALISKGSHSTRF